MNQAPTASYPKTKPRILFLYCELAPYFIACLRKLVELHEVEAHVVRLPLNSKDAPFEIEEIENIFYYGRQNFNTDNLQQLCRELKPDFLYVNGWKDSVYLKISRSFYGEIPTVLTFDNPWQGKVRQKIFSFLGPVWFARTFSHCWVPGEPQKKYALNLGFKDSEILSGMYSADVDYFQSRYQQFRDEKARTFPKRILFVGRYTDHKGVLEMWDAFIQFQSDNPNEWELWCIGKGELEDSFPDHEKIKNFGFVQPTEIETFIKDCGVFILPSKFEHWGVVVHEFAASGFPIISSDKTAAAGVFLKDGYNGICVKADDKQSLELAFKKLLEFSEEELLEMGDRSVELAMAITPEKWAGQIIGLIKDKELCVAS